PPAERAGAGPRAGGRQSGLFDRLPDGQRVDGRPGRPARTRAASGWRLAPRAHISGAGACGHGPGCASGRAPIHPAAASRGAGRAGAPQSHAVPVAVAMPEVTGFEVVSDQRLGEGGFLRLRRTFLRNLHADGTRSREYLCDFVERPRGLDAVALVIWTRAG